MIKHKVMPFSSLSSFSIHGLGRLVHWSDIYQSKGSNPSNFVSLSPLPGSGDSVEAAARRGPSHQGGNMRGTEAPSDFSWLKNNSYAVNALKTELERAT